MADIASIGVKFDGTDLEHGIRLLTALEAHGPRLEQSMGRIEGAAARTGRTLATLGQGVNLGGVNSASASAAAGIDRLGQSAAQAAASVGALGAASGAAQGGLNRTAQGANNSAEAMRAASASANVLTNAMSGLAAGFGAAQLIGITDQYTKFTAQLKLATTGATDYANAMNSVKAISTAAQADIGSIGTLYARIANSTREAGLSQKQLADITSTVGFSLKASGAGANEASSAMLQLSQAFGSGVLNGQEFASIAEAAPGLLQILADSMGRTRGELKKMAEEGKLTTGAMVKAFSDPAVVAAEKERAAAVQTISGAFVVLKNEVMGFVGVSAQSSGAVSALTGGITALAKNLDLVAGAALTLTAVKVAIWMEAGITATYAKVAAQRVLLASNLATAQSEATAAGAASVLTAARVAELRAAVLAAEGNVALAITTNGLIPAQARAAVAADAHAASLAALSVAQRAASVSGGLVSGAIGLLGGPVGAIVTLLGLGATAWYMWGKSSEDASNKAAGAVAATTGEIIANLDKQIEKAQRRLDLARQGNAELAKAATPETDKAADTLKEINRLKALGSAISGADSIRLIEQVATLEAIVGKTKTLAAVTADISAVGQQSKAAAALQEMAQRNSGIPKTYLSDLKAYQDALAAGEIKMPAYIAAVSELAKTTYDASKAGKEAAKGIKAGGAAAKAEQTQYEKLVASIKTKIAQNDEEVRTGGKLNDAEKLRAKLLAETGAGTRKATAAHEAETQALLAKLDVSERAHAVYLAQQKFEGERDKEAQSIAGEIAKINEKAQALEDEAAAYGKTASELQALTIARLEEKKAIIGQFDGAGDRIAKIDAEIAALQRLGSATDALAGKKLETSVDEVMRSAKAQAALYADEAKMAGLSALEREKIVALRKVELDYEKKMADVRKSGATEEEKQDALRKLNEAKQIEGTAAVGKVVEDSWNKTADSINQSLTDALLRGFESGKDFAKNMRDTIVNMFKTMVLRPVISAVMAPVAGALSGAVNAATGGGVLGNAGAAISGASMLGGTFGMGLSSGFSALFGEAGIMGALDAGGIALGAGNIMGGLGTIAGALGPIALGIGAIAMLAKSFTSRGANHAGGVYGTTGASNTDIAQSLTGNLGWKDPGEDLTTRGSAAVDATVKTSVNSLLAMYNDLAKIANGSAKSIDVIAGFATNAKHKDEASYGYFQIIDKATGDILKAYSNRELSASGEEAFSQFAADLGAGMVQQLLAADIPSWMSSILKDLGDTPTMDGLTKAVALIKQTDAVFGQMALNISGFGSVSDTAREAMIAAAGGIDKLAGAASAYYDIFYSDAEKLANSTRDVGKVFQDLGLEVPTANAGLRTLIEQQQGLGVKGAETAAKLMVVAPAFDAVTKATAAQEKAYKSIAVSLGLVIGKSDDYIAKLAKQAGGGDDLLQQSANYYNKFYTEAERAQVTIDEATGALADFGLEMPNTRQGFNDMMRAAVNMGDAGVGMVAALLKAADGADLFIGKMEGVAAAAGGGGLNQYGGVGDSKFAAGGSAPGARDWDFIPGGVSAAYDAVTTLSQQTAEALVKVAEALTKLATPAEDAYAAIDTEARKKRSANSYIEGQAAYEQKNLNNRSELTGLQSKVSTLYTDNHAGNWAWDISNDSAQPVIDALSKSSIGDEVKRLATAYGSDLKGFFSAVEATITGAIKGTYRTEEVVGGSIAALAKLNREIDLWTLAQKRVLATDALVSLAQETADTTAKIDELKLTGGTTSPISSLKSLFSRKQKELGGGIIASLATEKEFQSGLVKRYQDYSARMVLANTDRTNGLYNPEIDAEGRKLFGSSFRAMQLDITGNIKTIEEFVSKALANIDELTEEQGTYAAGLGKWYAEQKRLLSTEMLVDINQQIAALQATEKGPLTTIKEAIQKYIDDLSELGGLDAAAQTAVDKLSALQLTKARKSLYDQLLSPDELKTSNEYDLTMQFMGLGAAMPASTAALRDMIDAAQAAGNITLADSLLELVPAFVALQGAAGGMGDALGDALTAAQKSTDDAFAALQRAIDAQRKTLGTQLTAAQELQREVSSVFDSLKSAVSDLYRSVDSTAQQSAETARAFIANALSGALATGALPDSKELQDAITAARGGMDSQQYATQFDADRERLVLAGKLDQLKAVGGKQLTEAERQIKVLQEQLDALDLMLQTARDQIDVMRGIDISVMSVESAVQALGVAIAAETAAILALAGSAAKPVTTAPQTGGVYPKPWTDPGDGGLYINGRLTGGVYPKPWEPPSYDIGTNLVPSDMLAQIHEGEAIIPKAFNPWAGGGMGGSNSSDLISELRALRTEVQYLRAEVADGNSNTRQLADQFDSVSAGGNALATEVMA